jgi:hypothetical protein
MELMASRLTFATTLCVGAMAAPLGAQDTLLAGMPDDRFAEIAKTVPGFAGWWWDGTTLVLMLVDTAQRDAAVTAIAPDMRQQYIRRVLVRKADFDFIQLRRWMLLVPFFADSQITAVDADEVRNRVVVSVADSAYLAPTRERLVALGIPLRALVLEIMRGVKPLSATRAAQTPDTVPARLIDARGDTAALSVPDTVRRGQEFTVTVTAFAGGCIREPGQNRVRIHGLVADVTLLYVRRVGGNVCTSDEILFRQTILVRFDTAGIGRIRFHGAANRLDFGAQPQCVVIERTVVVR